MQVQHLVELVQLKQLECLHLKTGCEPTGEVVPAVTTFVEHNVDSAVDAEVAESMDSAVEPAACKGQ